MKKRWIVLIVAAAVAVVGMTVGTAMAAAPENAQHSRAAATRQTRQAAPREQTSTPEATQEPTATPAPNAQQPAAENNAAACPNHNENCPSDCTWRYGAGAAQTENDGCPYHGTDCPGDCMWYNGKGCLLYTSALTLRLRTRMGLTYPERKLPHRITKIWKRNRQRQYAGMKTSKAKLLK